MGKGKLWKIGFMLLLVAIVAGGTRPASRWWWKRRHDAWAAECRVARRDKRWDDLRRLAGQWADRDPQSADPWLFLAEAAQGLGDMPAVAEALSRISATDPKIVPALTQLALVEFGPLHRPREGEAACLRLLQIEPRDPFAHQSLIQYYAVSLQREKLLRQIRFAIDHHREPPEAYVFLFMLDSLRIGNAAAFIEKWVEANPDDELFVVAQTIQRPGSSDNAASEPPDPLDGVRSGITEKSKLLETLLDKYPSNLELLALEISRCRFRGEVDRVAELLSRAPEAADRDSRFWCFKGWLHETLDELSDAEIAYHKALEINSLNWTARDRLAVCRRQRRDHREVERLTALVEEARELRTKIRSLSSPELVTPEILAGISDYARKCGADWVAEAIDRRTGSPQEKRSVDVPGGI